MIRNIITGYWYALLRLFNVLDQSIVLVADQRKLKCDSCDFEKTLLGVKFCDGCGCVLTAKRLSDSQCPKGLWDISGRDYYLLRYEGGELVTNDEGIVKFEKLKDARLYVAQYDLEVTYVYTHSKTIQG